MPPPMSKQVVSNSNAVVVGAGGSAYTVVVVVAHVVAVSCSSTTSQLVLVAYATSLVHEVDLTLQCDGVRWHDPPSPSGVAVVVYPSHTVSTANM